MKNKLNKKELKDHINKNGFFATAIIQKVDINSLDDLQKEAYMPAAVKGQVPEGATYFKAIASTGELNRDGYIIREESWKAAIAGYMENPVLLLQHDMDQPIGRVLTAHLGNEGLVISGYLFDDLTGNRFSKGLFNAVSTGHITEGREFVNEETGEVLAEEEFRRLSWEEKENGKWIMAVTALDWLENSIVSIGANRKSLVKQRDVVKNYIEALKNESNEEEKTEKVEPKIEEKQTETEKLAVEKEQEEKPAAEVEKAENAIETKETATVEVSVQELNEASEALKTLANVAQNQQAEIASLKNQVEGLKAALNSIPVRKGLVFTASGNNTVKEGKQTKQGSWLAPLLDAAGVSVKD